MRPKKIDAYVKMGVHEPVKWITPEVNSKRKGSVYEEKIENRKKINLFNYYKSLKNIDSGSKE